jgi:tetratricopeptide (TPR) repeat protein
MRHLAFSLAICALFAFPALADEGMHHEDLTTAQVGTVDFPTSCAPAVQKPFERGVALLHSFWYEEAQKEFEQIEKDDPKCAMAHWGVAMSLWHQLWNHPEGDVARHGLAEVKAGEALHPKTARERDYLAAMDAFYSRAGKSDYQTSATAYSQAMEKLHDKYPEDHEAAIFYALSLLAAEPDGDTTFANRKKAAAVLEPLFAAQPDHPGVAHYLIHSYDKPQLAQLGLPAAQRYAQIAPAAPHALHMPSHIFARLGLWQDDINSNLASVSATRKTAAMHMGGEGHQFHALDFLVYAYLQCGREADAMKVIEEVRAMPAMKDDMYGSDYDPRIFALSTFPANYAIELHHWSDAAALTPVPGAHLGDEAYTHYARAIGAARSGNVEQARKEVAEMDAIHTKALDKKKTELAGYVEDERKVAQAWVDHLDGKDEQAIAALRSEAEKEEAVGDEPGGLPAREMLGDLLMELKRPEQALAEYEADLKFNPNRFDGLYGAAQAAEMAKKTDKADQYYAQVVKLCGGANSDRPELTRAKSLMAEK